MHRFVLTVLLIIASVSVSGWLWVLVPLVWWRELSVTLMLYAFTRWMRVVQVRRNG